MRLGKFALGTALAAVLALSSGSAFAAKQDLKSGGIDLTNAPTNSQVTPFTTVNVGGGTWDYGTSATGLNEKTVWSNYLHNTLTHGSSCSIGANFSDSGWVAPKSTSFSSAVGGWSDTTHAYWKTQ